MQSPPPIEDILARRCRINQKQLEAYQKAYNKIDDYMEYRGMTKQDFAAITEQLNKDLKEACNA